MQLQGKVYTQNILGNKRKFASLVIPHGELCQIAKPKVYNASTGQGNQRVENLTHLKNLVSEMRNGTFTPTTVAVSFAEAQLKELKFVEDNFEYEVKKDAPLMLSDGQHRQGALATLKLEIEKQLAVLSDDEKTNRKQIQFFKEAIADIDQVHVPVILYLDGNAQHDFAALQSGRGADKTHLMAMGAKLNADPEMTFAVRVAKLLNQTKNGAFFERIRLDARGSNPIPMASLCGRAASELSTSLVGLAKVSSFAGFGEDAAAKLVNEVVYSLEDFAPQLIEYGENGRVLTTSRNNGAIGSSTMLIGLSICLAYRIHIQGTELTAEDRKGLAEAAKMTLDLEGRNNLSAASKRKLIGEFARQYFQDVIGDGIVSHCGIPVELLSLLSVSSFDCEKLPKSKKSK